MRQILSVQRERREERGMRANETDRERNIEKENERGRERRVCVLTIEGHQKAGHPA